MTQATKYSRLSGYGYSPDKRKRRNQHRTAARQLIKDGTFLNPGCAPRGSIPGVMAQWHLNNARWLGR
jgi:hypothetical protein